MALSEIRMGCCAESSRGGRISYNGDETSAERGTLVAAILTRFDYNWYYIEPSSNLCLIPEREAYHISSWLRNPQVFLFIADKCTALAESKSRLDMASAKRACINIIQHSMAWRGRIHVLGQSIHI